jgi:TonB family protein
MTSGPIDKRLRDCADDADAVTARAAKLMRAVPEPAPLSEWARRRTLRALGASVRNGRVFHVSVLHWAVLSLLVVSTAAASSKQVWFPRWFHRKAAFVERTTDIVVVDEEPAAPTPSKPASHARDEAASSSGSAARPRARANAKTAIVSVEEPKSVPVRPRLLSDPQNDAVAAHALPKLVYDAETYSVLLDVCVSTDGDVTKASVVRGQEASLDRDILEAVRHWKYRPGEVDGVRVSMCFPLVYRIQVPLD